MEERFGNVIVNFIRKKLKSEKTVRVLEIGFGEGKCLLDLYSIFPQVEFYGINKETGGSMYSRKNFLKNAKEFEVKVSLDNLPRPFFYDVEKGLKFKDNFFDLVISQVSIPYVGNKAKLYEEVWRVLKPEGSAFLHIDRTRIPALPEFLKVKTETPLCIIYENNKIIEFKKVINRIRKKGFDVRLTWSLPKKKQRNLLMTKNNSQALKLGLVYDGESTLYLTPLKGSDKYKDKPGIWWGTRSVFKVKSKK